MSNATKVKLDQYFPQNSHTKFQDNLKGRQRKIWKTEWTE